MHTKFYLLLVSAALFVNGCQSSGAGGGGC